ncbi:MAG: N-formylglutamate amidohydrolase, partial [Pseudomonadota bacterium]
PDDLNCLGLPGDILETHIAWDIGAGALACALAERLEATFFRCGYSRLVVDPNRAVEVDDLIPAASDQIPIPGNQMLNSEERAARIERFHVPYHEDLDGVLDKMTASGAHPFVVSVHSFTNRLMGAASDRPWSVGLLWREDERSARSMIDYLSTVKDWRIGDNEPYDARQFNYSVDRHIGPRKLPHLTLEIRQDLILNEEGVTEMADILARGVRHIEMTTAERP